jgi:threonine dehydratase
MGSGICAHIAVRDLLGKPVDIVGVVAAGAPAHALSFRAGMVVPTAQASTFVDGVATRSPDAAAVDVMVRGAARFIEVPDEATLEAMEVLWRTTHHMPEPAGAIALAGLLADSARRPGTATALVMSGGNCDADIAARALSLVRR